MSAEQFNAQNRLENLDSIEYKIINKLLNSDSSHADKIWKLLKYADIDALSKPSVPKAERAQLISTDSGVEGDKRVFLAPFTNDAFTDQCAHLHVYIEGIYPRDHLSAQIIVGVETIVHSKISAITAESDEDPTANPNDYETKEKEKQLVCYKNRATVLLKHVLAELNGLYIDGVGNLEFDRRTSMYCSSTYGLWNNRAYYGHLSKLAVVMSGISESPDLGF